MNKFKTELAGVYTFLEHKILIVSWSSIIVAMIFDMLPFPYFNKRIEAIFSFDLGNLLAIAIMIWSFVTVLLVFYMESLKERCFGIGLKEAIQLDENYDYFKKVGILFAGELLMLIVVVIFEWPITMIVLNLLLILFAIYAFTLICYYSSEDRIVAIVKKGFDNTLGEAAGKGEAEVLQLFSKNYLFRQMITKLDYQKKDEVEKLLEWLRTVSRQADWGQYIHVVKYLIELILSNKVENKEVYDVIQKWFVDNTTCEACKEEIFKTLIKDGGKDSLDCCMRLISMVKDRDERQVMMIAFMAYNEVMMLGIEQEYRNVYYNKVYNRVGELYDSDMRIYQEKKSAFEEEVLR